MEWRTKGASTEELHESSAFFGARGSDLSKGTLEQQLQKIYEAGIGVSITWLRDGEVDLRLVHKTGVVAAEGTVQEVADVLPWLEQAIKKNFPKADYQHTRASEMPHDAFSFAWRSKGDTARH
jgi:hypothetical protein